MLNNTERGIYKGRGETYVSKGTGWGHSNDSDNNRKREEVRQEIRRAWETTAVMAAGWSRSWWEDPVEIRGCVTETPELDLLRRDLEILKLPY